MAFSHLDAMPSPFARAMRHCVDTLRTPPPRDVDQDASCPRHTKPVTFTDVNDPPTLLASSASGSNGNWSDVVSRAPTFGLVQLKAAFVWIYSLVIILIVQVAIIASDVVTLKARLTAIEGTKAAALVHDQQSEEIAILRERIADLERSRRADSESHKMTIQELATSSKAHDEAFEQFSESYKGTIQELTTDNKTRDDAFAKLSESFKMLQYSLEIQKARVTGIKADHALKISLIQSDVARVKTGCTAFQTISLPANVESAGRAAKEARKARILAGVTQRMEDDELMKGNVHLFGTQSLANAGFTPRN